MSKTRAEYQVSSQTVAYTAVNTANRLRMSGLIVASIVAWVIMSIVPRNSQHKWLAATKKGWCVPALFCR